jgi:ComF family protein
MNVLMRWVEGGRAAGRLVLNTVLPPQCLACNTMVGAPGNLCAPCFGRVTFITPPHCGVCGLPLDQTVIEDLLCGACVALRPVYHQARAAFIYNDDSRALILKFKHGDRTDMAVYLARWMFRAGRDLVEAADVIVPVPLHRWRLLARSYNQSALLGRALARLSGKPIAPNALTRIKPTRSQGGLKKADRRRNVARAFVVRRAREVEGKRVLLVDDVLTSGATANACAATLLAAGALAVDVLALARVPHPADTV